MVTTGQATLFMGLPLFVREEGGEPLGHLLGACQVGMSTELEDGLLFYGLQPCCPGWSPPPILQHLAQCPITSH